MSSGKVAVIVGAGGGGIGDHCCAKFRDEGYKVCVLSRTKSNLDRIEKELGESVRGYVCDAGVGSDVEKTVAEILQAHGGRIDVLIYNAGVGMFKSFDETSESDFELCWRSGPAGLFSFVKAVKPVMLKNGGGAIGVTGATASWRGVPFTAAFASAKAGLRLLTQSLSRDLGPQNIHVFHVIVDGMIWMEKVRQRMPNQDWEIEPQAPLCLRFWGRRRGDIINFPILLSAQRPRVVNKPEEECIKPSAIAEVYSQMVNQHPSCWTTEFNIIPAPVMGTMLSI